MPAAERWRRAHRTDASRSKKRSPWSRNHGNERQRPPDDVRGGYLTASFSLRKFGLEALLGSDDSFKAAIHRVKNHPGQMAAAAFCRELLSASGNLRNLDGLRAQLSGQRLADQQGVMRVEESIQTPYSLRCVPQGIGPMLDALIEHRRTLEREANSVNDNPLIDPVEGQIYHTGNFYGGHVARALDSWKIDLATMANWLHALMAMLVDDRFSNGLPPNLSPNPGVSTGFKGMQLCLTSLVCALRQSASPSMIHSLPTEQYNQDMVSLGPTRRHRDGHDRAPAQRAGDRAHRARPSDRPAGRRKPSRLGQSALFAELRSELAFLNEDRALDGDIENYRTKSSNGVCRCRSWRVAYEYFRRFGIP